MDIVITSRHAEISDRLRRHVEEKLAKVGQLSPRARRVEVTISHEANPRQAAHSERIELTVRDRGPVIRAEAAADDVYGALDLAQEKLVERLRRVRDKRKDHHSNHGRQSAAEMRAATFEAEQASLLASETDSTQPSAEEADDSPVTVREKVHHAPPMTLDDALYQMELVGHDFYLFVDSACDVPSVVYRRRGWSYGVLRLDTSPKDEPEG